MPHLVDNGLYRSGPLPASSERYDAVGTHIVAPSHDGTNKTTNRVQHEHLKSSVQIILFVSILFNVCLTTLTICDMKVNVSLPLKHL